MVKEQITAETADKKQKPWIVTRIVREKFEVEYAENAQEAKDRAENPYSVEVVKEMARRKKAGSDG